MTENYYCKVTNCDDKKNHCTRGHKCESCGTFGHGTIECMSQTLQRNLEKYYDDVIPNDQICDVKYCKYKFYHTYEGHIPVKTVKCPLCRTLNPTSKVTKIYQHKDQCVICYERKIEIRFLRCNHSCVCAPCYNKL
jgi:hypothetical protein